mmetsp:Transcript_38028/g.79654  ORF Transcript_38028/g.79654 Transcript_38028/m.79654 type:complete len:433 (+) Transcript_38028:247-1545(+)
MIRRSPIKSPMQKLSNVGNKIATRGSQLIDSASSAVAQGTHLSSVVASKANAKAEEIATQVRSPDKRRTSRSGGGKGIRDRINKFDSASKKGNMEYHSTTPYRQGRTSRGSTSTYTSTNTHRRSRGGDVYEAETMMPPPCNPSFYAKENDEPNNQNEASFDSGSFTSKDYGGKSTIRRKKNRKKRQGATSPENPNYRENEAKVAEGNDTQETRSNSKHYETETERNQSRESRNGYDRRQENGQHTNVENVDIADLNRAAIFQTSTKDRVTNNHRSHVAVPRTNNHHHNTNASSVGMTRIKKREKADHPLIASPLRKHMRGVHDSATSNATCTLVKDPFPLLPPKCDRPLAAVAHWEREERNRAGCGSSSNGGDMGYLGTLGSVTGTLKVGDVHRDNRGEGGATSSMKNGEEDALDLLTSAAFMFKHSRRNLG